MTMVMMMMMQRVLVSQICDTYSFDRITVMMMMMMMMMQKGVGVTDL